MRLNRQTPHREIGQVRPAILGSAQDEGAPCLGSSAPAISNYCAQQYSCIVDTATVKLYI